MDKNQIIKLFNSITGKSFRFSCQDNIDAVEAFILPYDPTLLEVRNFFIDWKLNGGDIEDRKAFINACIAFKESRSKKGLDVEAVYEEETAVAETPVLLTKQATDDAMTLLASAMTTVLAQTKADEIASSVLSKVENLTRDYIAKEYGPITRKVLVDVNAVHYDLGQEVVHEKMCDVLRWLKLGFNVYMPGPAGSGKGYIARQAAKLLNREFYCASKVAYEHELMGFIDAGGKYHETEFYKAYTGGGLFFLDEMDASDAVALNAMNGALADGICAFPIGKKEMHPDFLCIAAGNTYGKGATMQYVGRNQIDDATLNRFAVVEVDYSPEIEALKANGDEKILEFIRDFRNACVVGGVLKVVSYRDIDRITKLYYGTNKALIKEALIQGLFGGMQKDSLNSVYTNLAKKENVFAKAMQSIIREG